MSWLRTILAEAVGLFVDDTSFALVILAWLAFAWLVLPRLALPVPWPPVLLFAGLVLILLESAVRRAGR